MAPTTYMVSPSEYNGEEPISRTYQYRKVMKPLLERKRRARINRCLDELKELMVTTLQSEGENVSKLEKADILELTVRHLHTLKRQHQLVIPNEQSCTDRFRAGFSQCAQEVSQFIGGAAPGNQHQQQGAATSESKQQQQHNIMIEPTAGKRLIQHLGACVRQMDSPPPQPPQSPHQSPQQSPPPQSMPCNNNNTNGRGSYSPPPHSPPHHQHHRHQDVVKVKSMWRPW